MRMKKLPGLRFRRLLSLVGHRDDHLWLRRSPQSVCAHLMVSGRKSLPEDRVVRLEVKHQVISG